MLVSVNWLRKFWSMAHTTRKFHVRNLCLTKRCQGSSEESYILTSGLERGVLTSAFSFGIAGRSKRCSLRMVSVLN